MASRTSVTLHAEAYSYPIIVGAGLLAQAGSFMREVLPQAQKVLIVTEPHLAEYFGSELENSLTPAGFTCHEIALIEGGEAHKTQATIQTLYEKAHAFGLKRQDVVIAFGGGIIGDMTGFFAATFLRGVPFIQIPTTLLAQVDASVGGKVGINWHDLKNYIGAFYHPAGVLIDTATLAKLPAETFACGMAEVIKTSLLEYSVPNVTIETPLFETLGQNMETLQQHPEQLEPIIRRCCDLKAAVVSADPEERRGIREMLNLGHTFGHAYETLSQGEIAHGEAVSMGMVKAFTLAQQLGQIDEAAVSQVTELLQRAGLPIAPPKPFAPEEILRIMGQDKKVLVSDTLRLVLPYERLGQVRIQKDMTSDMVRTVL
jgi:3-dehydroquinate synthase